MADLLYSWQVSSGFWERSNSEVKKYSTQTVRHCRQVLTISQNWENKASLHRQCLSWVCVLSASGSWSVSTGVPQATQRPWSALHCLRQHPSYAGYESTGFQKEMASQDHTFKSLSNVACFLGSQSTAVCYSGAQMLFPPKGTCRGWLKEQQSACLSLQCQGCAPILGS